MDEKKEDRTYFNLLKNFIHTYELNDLEKRLTNFFKRGLGDYFCLNANDKIKKFDKKSVKAAMTPIDSEYFDDYSCDILYRGNVADFFDIYIGNRALFVNNESNKEDLKKLTVKYNSRLAESKSELLKIIYTTESLKDVEKMAYFLGFMHIAKKRGDSKHFKLAYEKLTFLLEKYAEFGKNLLEFA